MRFIMSWTCKPFIQCFILIFIMPMEGTNATSRDEILINTKPCNNDCETTTYAFINIGKAATTHTIQIDAMTTSYFFVVQVHSYLDEMQLSYDPVPNRTNSVRGTDIGLNQIIDKTNYSFYLFNNFTDTRQVLVAVTAYLETDPIPGGCNMEFNTLTAPYQSISFTEDMITVDVQSASVYNRLCELPENISMEFYQTFAPEPTINSTLSTIINMMTVDKIKQNGHKVVEPINGPNLRRYYSNYLGFPAVYAVIASIGNRSSAYVPISTYGCDMHNGTESCFKLVKSDWIMMSVSAVASFVLLLTPVNVLVPIYNFGYYGSKAGLTFAGYPVLFFLFVYEVAGMVLVVSGLLCYIAKKFSAEKIVLRIYSAHILTALIYFGTATGDYLIIQTPAFFWILYACLISMMLMPGLDPVAAFVNIFFHIILTVDSLIGNNRMMYFNINAVRCAAVSKFYLASLYAPNSSTFVIGALFALVVLCGLRKCICCRHNSPVTGESQPLLG